MERNASMASDLVRRLAAAGMRGRVAGGGVHWQVDVEPVGTRAVTVHCFWYDRGIHGLMLGLNPANARSQLRAAPVPYQGPQYYTIVRDGDVDIADGRTHDVADAVAAARAWLAGADLEELARGVPFIDRKGRAMRALAARIDPALRSSLGSDPVFDLWIYGDGRSCKLEPEDDDSISCAFLLGQAQVARAAVVDDAPAAVAAWLVESLPLRLLVTRVPGVALEPHAEVLETDPARWHWLHFRDRIADPGDVLAPLRPLIEALATSPVATRFYTYSSLHMLCFSASSHYPWVDDGLPVVWAVEPGVYLVGDNAARRIADDVARTATPCDLARAVPLIEGMLAASRFQPFFGSRPHRDLPLVSECFARQGSALRPRLVQTGPWYNLVVADAAGARSCTMGELDATFKDDSGSLSAEWPTIDDAVRAVRRYLEDGATLDQVAVDPLAQDVFRRPAIPRPRRRRRVVWVLGAVAAVPVALLLAIVLRIALWSHDCRALPALIERHQQRLGALLATLDENDPALAEALARAFDDAARDTQAAVVTGKLQPYAQAHRDRMTRASAASRALAEAARAGDHAQTARAKAALAIDGVSMQAKDRMDIQGVCTE